MQDAPESTLPDCRGPEIEIPEAVFLRLAEYGRNIPDPVNPDDDDL